MRALLSFLKDLYRAIARPADVLGEPSCRVSAHRLK